MVTRKTGIILLNLGGPDSLDAVKPFLYNLFSDPDIIQLFWSGLFQKPLAWLITTFRAKSVTESYRLMGGRSPILPLTQAQADGMQDLLRQDGLDLPVYLGMRYWHPTIEDTVDRMIADGVTDVIALPMFPQYSLTTTGSAMQELERVMQARGYNIPVTLIHHYHDHPDYLAAVADRMKAALETRPWSCPQKDVLILFSAHSLPKRFVERTGDIYPQHVDETVRLLMMQYFPQHAWQVCYQSKIGKIPWLEPYTDDALKDLAAQKTDNILMVPISFVSDHIETLYEIDLLYMPLARDLNIAHCHRMDSLNDHPLFLRALANLVKACVAPPVGVA